jgi:hypothetical protein
MLIKIMREDMITYELKRNMGFFFLIKKPIPYHI